MGSLIKHAKKIKKACIGIATGVTVATMMIPPIVLSQMIMMDQEDKCSSEATGSIDVSSDGTVEENKKAIWNYFKASGYSDEATAGIMGNMYAESGFKPGASEIGGAGYGLVQWTTQGYKTALKNYAAQQGKETSDLKLQLDFLCIQQLPTFKWSVRGTTYFKDTEELKKSNSVTKVTEAFMNCFERCNTSYVSCTVERRSQYSMKVYNQFRGQSADADSASTGISGRILWVGDSRTVGMQSAITEGKNKWICSVGKGYNWLVNTAINKVNKELKDTDTIVVNLGVNDLNNYEKYVTKLNSLVDSDWKKAKSIVVMSVNPVDEAKCAGTYVVKNSQIEKFNTYLKKNLRKKIAYVDTYTSLLGNIQTNDGLHYTSTTYKTIYDMIRDTHTGSSTDSACESEGSGGILTAEGVMIDFDSKYYTYNADINEGNPNVCAVNKPQWWPYGAACTNQSITGKFNKMICSSYASGRYWDVNYHDSPYPLPTNWDQKLTVDHVAPGSGKYSKDINNPIPKSIVSITSSSGGTMHVAFIEGVDVDGSVVISECNANRNEPKYGFRCQKWKNVKEWAERTLGAGNQIEWFLWKVDDKNMLKKILIGIVVLIIVCFGGYDIYTRIQKSHEPELVFVDKDLRTVAEDNFNPYYYVIKAEDYRGKDINDKKHLAYKVKSKGKKSVKVIYILTDDKGHFVQKELTLKKVKTVNYTPEGEQNGALSNAPKKENKVFLFSDYDQIAIRAMAEADNYGYESSQNYTVNPALDENGELIGYECVFLN